MLFIPIHSWELDIVHSWDCGIIHSWDVRVVIGDKLEITSLELKVQLFMRYILGITSLELKVLRLSMQYIGM